MLNSKVISVTVKPPPRSLLTPLEIEFAHMHNVSLRALPGISAHGLQRLPMRPGELMPISQLCRGCREPLGAGQVVPGLWEGAALPPPPMCVLRLLSQHLCAPSHQIQ